MIVYLNGKFIPESRAAISIYDHGFLYGDGVYETMRVYDGKVFLINEHMKRLANSLQGIHLKSPGSSEKIARAIQKTVSANRHQEAAVRLTITRGIGPQGFDPHMCKTPTVLITSRPFTGYPAVFHKRGIPVLVSSLRRNSPEALPPSIKSISCLNNVLAKIEANTFKAKEAIFLGEDNNLLEGTISNFFLVKQGQIFTPALDGRQLPGVTREVVCRLAREIGITLSETKVSIHDLEAADEFFLTSSLMEIMPIKQLVFANRSHSEIVRSVGETTKKLMDCYRRFTQS